MTKSPTAETVDRKEWRRFFDSVSSSLRGKGADITLSSVTGDVHQSRLWQLHGVSYDPHDDALIVSCRQQEHVISNPESITIERIGPSISSVEVAMKQQGEREIIRFVSPVMLSAH